MNSPVLMAGNLALACVLLGASIGYFMRGPKKPAKQKASEDMATLPPVVSETDPAKKPGWKTTEFWSLLTGKAIIATVNFVVLNQSDLTQLGGQITAGSVTTASVLAIVGMINRYGDNRTAVKTGQPVE